MAKKYAALNAKFTMRTHNELLCLITPQAVIGVDGILMNQARTSAEATLTFRSRQKLTFSVNTVTFTAPITTENRK